MSFHLQMISPFALSVGPLATLDVTSVRSAGFSSRCYVLFLVEEEGEIHLAALLPQVYKKSPRRRNGAQAIAQQSSQLRLLLRHQGGMTLTLGKPTQR